MSSGSVELFVEMGSGRSAGSLSPHQPPTQHARADAQIAALEEMELGQLQTEWRRLYRSQPPQRISRHLLVLALAWKIQERAQGGVAASVRRRLDALSSTSETEHAGKRMAPIARLKCGAQLVREWHGETHLVRVLDDGFEWRDRHYRSLSAIAREITGAHWSGPRFFGLRQFQRNGHG